MDKKLTDKQKKFCLEYIRDWNATRAAIAAGYSERSAKEIGCENLTKPNIKQFIEETLSDVGKVVGISKVSQLEELKKILLAKGEQTKDRLKAIEIINKMLGLNEAEKHDHTSKGNEISVSPITWVNGSDKQ
jgi:phage terminase small subunit